MRRALLFRYLLIALTIPAGLSNRLAGEESAYPYTGRIVIGGTDVRSGPGDNYYVTDHLELGDEVEVYRRDPGGWLAVRPPEGSYSWLPIRKTQRTDERDVVEIVTDDAVAYMGSNVHDVKRHRWQVRLERGERVRIVYPTGASRLEDESTEWYRIAAPAGEFRWVHEDAVSRVRAPRPAAARRPARQPVRDAAIQPSLAVEGVAVAAAPASGASEGPSASGSEAATADAASGGTSISSGAEWQPARRRHTADDGATTTNSGVQPAMFLAENTGRSRAAAPNAPANPAPAASDRGSAPAARDQRVAWSPRSPRREAEQLDRLASPSMPTNLPTPPATVNATPTPPGRSELELERQDIELQLSLMVSRDVRLWNLAALRGRTEALIQASPSPLERGQARLLLEQIAEFEDLYDRHVQSERAVAVSSPTDPATGRPSVARLEPRFDGSGWLVPVHSTKRAAPPYAISDDSGKVLAYVTPAPGVNLHRYERKRVGIYGQRNTVPDLSNQVLTAHRVVDLSRHTTR